MAGVTYYAGDGTAAAAYEASKRNRGPELKEEPDANAWLAFRFGEYPQDDCDGLAKALSMAWDDSASVAAEVREVLDMLEDAFPCGVTIGHGERCSDGGLCPACAVMEKAAAKLELLLQS